MIRFKYSLSFPPLPNIHNPVIMFFCSAKNKWYPLLNPTFLNFDHTRLAMTEVNNSQSHGTVFISARWCLQAQKVLKMERSETRSQIECKIQFKNINGKTITINSNSLVALPLCPDQQLKGMQTLMMRAL